MANEALNRRGRGQWRGRGGARQGRDHGELHGRSRRCVVRHAGDRRFLGTLVRAVQATGPGSRARRARGNGAVRHGQAQHRREPGRSRSRCASSRSRRFYAFKRRRPVRRVRRRRAGKTGQAVRAAAGRRSRRSLAGRGSPAAWPKRRRRKGDHASAGALYCPGRAARPREPGGDRRPRRVRWSARGEPRPGAPGARPRPKELAAHARHRGGAHGARSLPSRPQKAMGSAGKLRARIEQKPGTITRPVSNWRRVCSAPASARRRSMNC